jgi:hypothetical protein
MNIIDEYVIRVDRITIPADIFNIGKMRDTKAFTYSIHAAVQHITGGKVIDSDVIKYGSSFDNEWKKDQYLNRIYRQLLGAPGWPGRNINGDTSSKIFEKVLQNHFPGTTYKDLTVVIKDYGDPEFMNHDYTTAKKILEAEEHKEIARYEIEYGRLPYGNEQKYTHKGHMALGQPWHTLFEPELV